LFPTEGNEGSEVFSQTGPKTEGNLVLFRIFCVAQWRFFPTIGNEGHGVFRRRDPGFLRYLLFRIFALSVLPRRGLAKMEALAEIDDLGEALALWRAVLRAL
jgi:hypothetical protein